MKKILLLILEIEYVTIVSAQRYAGYGRGLDWEKSINSGNTNSNLEFVIVLSVLILGITINIILKLKENYKLKTGKFIKVIKNGYAVSAPFDNVYSQPFEIMQNWKFEDFKNCFDSIELKEIKVTMDRKNIKSIYFIKANKKVTVLVEFECCSYNEVYDYKIAKVKNGNYYLYKM